WSSLPSTAEPLEREGRPHSPQGRPSMNPRRRRSELSDVDRTGEPGRAEPLSRTSAVVRLETSDRLIALPHQGADHLCGVGRDDVAPEVRDLLVAREA